MDRDAHAIRTKVGLHVALTPTWSETAFFADYVLPMGTGRSGTTCIRTRRTTRSGSASGRPVLRAARERLGETVSRHARRQPGRGVGGERVLDRAVVADRSGRHARHPPVLRIAASARAKSSASMSTTAGSSRTRCRVCPNAPRREGLTPLAFMRRYGAFEVAAQDRPAARGCRSPPERTGDVAASTVRARLRAQRQAGDAERRADCRAGRRRGRTPRRSACESTARSCAASRRRAASSSSTRARSPSGAGREYALPPYIKSHVHPDNLEPGQMVLDPDVPAADADPHARRQTRSGSTSSRNTNPLWINPIDAERLGALRTGDLVRVDDRDRLLRAQGVGDGGDPSRASSPAAITWAVGGSTVTTGSGRSPRRSRCDNDDATGRCAARPASVPIRRAIRIRSGFGGPTSASIRT